MKEGKLPYKIAAMAGGVPGGMLWKKLPRLRVSEEAFFRAGSRRAWGGGRDFQAVLAAAGQIPSAISRMSLRESSQPRQGSVMDLP